MDDAKKAEYFILTGTADRFGKLIEVMCRDWAKAMGVSIDIFMKKVKPAQLILRAIKELAEIYTDEEIEAGILFHKSVKEKSTIGTERLCLLVAEALDRAVKELGRTTSKPKITS